MKRIDRDQVLTTEAIDINGNQILMDGIDWSVYRKNPVLLYNRTTEGHRGVVIGRVENIRRIGNTHVGNLSFMERNRDAAIAFEKYSQGVLCFTSIGGFASGTVTDEDVFVAHTYVPLENSLVAIPANIECRALDKSEVLSSAEKKVVRRLEKKGEVRYVTMCAELLTKNEDMEEEKEVHRTIEAAVEPEPAEPEPAETVIEAAVEPEPAEPEPAETVIEAAVEPEPAEPEPAETVIEAAAQTRRMPAGMEWHEQQTITKTNTNMNKKFRDLTCDADFQRRMGYLGSAFRTGATSADNNPENSETVQILAQSMLNDDRMVMLAAATRIKSAVTHEAKNGLRMLLECAAGGAAAATLSAADLGVIQWLGLVYNKLLPNDTFRRSVRFVPMSDREGAIYVENAINPATYVGSVTPLNTTRYTYDDVKRTIARQVFSMQTVLFQHSDLAILAYDKQSVGFAAALDNLVSDISTYWLQVLANTPGLKIQGTTGASMATAGLFPLEAPNSALNVKQMTRADLIALQGLFLMQNYRLTQQRIEMVLPANLYTALSQDPLFSDINTRQNSGANEAEINYQAVKVTPRNPVARYNTSTSVVELDPSMYTDNTVANDGTPTAVSPAATTADHVGVGVAFVENELLAGIGTIDVIVTPDPENYGTKMSAWVSTGATLARQNGVGAALIVPTIG